MDVFPDTQARCFDIFNGDADGICALHQLRMAFPQKAIEVTGVKRDIALLEKISPKAGDRLTVLDISFDANGAALQRHLDAGAQVTYFDHHSANTVFTHPQLQFHWSEARDVCTSILVDRYLGGRYVMWAMVGAYGDNLNAVANGMAMQQSLSWADRSQLQELGKLLNYNAYGEQVEDLHLHPLELYREVQHYANPFDFIQSSPHFLALQYAHAEESTYLAGLKPASNNAWGAIYILPDVSWARRISGLLANKLHEERREQSFAVLTPKRGGGYVVSVRSAQPERQAASRFCEGFLGGGGRQLAAGINHLESADVDDFFARFFAYFIAL